MKQRPYYSGMNPMTLLKGKQNIGGVGGISSDIVIPNDPPRNDDNLIGRNAVSHSEKARRDWFENRKFIRDVMSGEIKVII